MKKFLMNNNRLNLISFLVANWCQKIPAKITRERLLALGYEESNAVESRSDGCSDSQDLTCDHEEADSQILFTVRLQL